jgi:hypothetical protein
MVRTNRDKHVGGKGASASGAIMKGGGSQSTKGAMTGEGSCTAKNVCGRS